MRWLATMVLAVGWLSAEADGARQAGPWYWTDVERVVAVGDLHGDFEQYRRILRAAGLIDKRDRWQGGETHLVQLGDIPDRGPDTRRINDHVQDLARQAQRAGGRVHVLIGNHDAMNVYGDLRYVDPGEYAAFAERGSERLLERYYEAFLEDLSARDPERLAAIEADPGFRERWFAERPPGWAEHRIAWQPSGEYGERVLQRPIAVRIDDTVFVHGGISPAYCDRTLDELATEAHEALTSFSLDAPGIVMDEDGPLWYRGLAQGDEATMQSAVDGLLECAGVNRIVVGHTPTPAIVWPRFGGAVIQADTGIAAHYGGFAAWLELVDGEARACYPDGCLDLPAPGPDWADDRLEYLDAMIERRPGVMELRRRRAELAESGAAEQGAGVGDG